MNRGGNNRDQCRELAKTGEKPSEIRIFLATLLRPSGGGGDDEKATKPKKTTGGTSARSSCAAASLCGGLYDGGGRRRLESTHGTERNDAEKLLRKRLSAKDAGVLPEAAIGSLTVNEATDDVIADYKTNGRKSLRDFESKIRLHLLPFFGERRRMSSITTANIRAFIAERQDADASAAEINRELAACVEPLTLPCRLRLIQRPHFPMLKERNTRRGFLESDQIAKICAALEATEDGDDGRKTAGALANVVRFAFATGWRTASPAAGVAEPRLGGAERPARRANDQERRRLGVPVHDRHRGSSYRAVGDSRAAQGGRTICPFVFHRDGERISHFRAAWKNACKAAGCPGALVHDMRRSAVRTFERAGVPRSVAMSTVGHKTESIYRRYAIVDETMQREAAARLDAFASSPERNGQLDSRTHQRVISAGCATLPQWAFTKAIRH